MHPGRSFLRISSRPFLGILILSPSRLPDPTLPGTSPPTSVAPTPQNVAAASGAAIGDDVTPPPSATPPPSPTSRRRGRRDAAAPPYPPPLDDALRLYQRRRSTLRDPSSLPDVASRQHVWPSLAKP